VPNAGKKVTQRPFNKLFEIKEFYAARNAMGQSSLILCFLERAFLKDSENSYAQSNRKLICAS